MAKLLIDIPEDMYTHVSTSDAYVLDDTDWILLENAIANGTPLDGLTNGEVAKLVFGLKSKDMSLKFRTPTWWNRKWGE